MKYTRNEIGQKVSVITLVAQSFSLGLVWKPVATRDKIVFCVLRGQN